MEGVPLSPSLTEGEPPDGSSVDEAADHARQQDAQPLDVEPDVNPGMLEHLFQVFDVLQPGFLIHPGFSGGTWKMEQCLSIEILAFSLG